MNFRQVDNRVKRLEIARRPDFEAKAEKQDRAWASAFVDLLEADPDLERIYRKANPPGATDWHLDALTEAECETLCRAMDRAEEIARQK